MKKKKICIIGSIFLILIFFSYSNNKNSMDLLINNGLVPNEETAIKIAEAIWYPIYGEKIYSKKPFKGNLKNGIWIVKGTLQDGHKGGVPYIEIQQIDCKVLTVSHGK